LKLILDQMAALIRYRPYQQALQGSEEKLGPKHPDMLRAVHNLVYGNQGRYEEAEQLHLRALQGREDGKSSGEALPFFLLLSNLPSC
jgi:Tetratricopeptide repeat